MSSTEDKRAWIARNLKIGASNQGQDSTDLSAFKAEAQTLRSSPQALVSDFDKISKLFIQLSASVKNGASATFLSSLSELNTSGGVGPAGQAQRAFTKDFDNIAGLFQKTSAGVITAAPSDSLSLLVQLDGGTSNGSSDEPRAWVSKFAEIGKSLEELSKSTGEMNAGSALSALSELERAVL
jgi:hypothetical protein